eukprot:m.120660 g.120660  ORF g.120660 m.120660 type:complete len:486 (+) comp17246_c0_seq1:257-1714(+)
MKTGNNHLGLQYVQCSILVAGLVCLLSDSLGVAAQKSADEHLEAGGKSLAGGDFSAALEHYHSACDADPAGYMNFYKRATVYLATGRARQAAKDLEQVLQNKPSFSPAKSRLAEIRMKDGSFDQAKELFESMGEGEENIKKMAMAKQQIEHGKTLLEGQDFPAAIDLFTQAIEVSPSYEPLRMLRAQAYQKSGQTGEAIGDVSRAAKLKSGNVEAFLLLSRLHYATGARNEALTQIRECVKLDADHKEAFKFYKKLKKFNKIMDKIDDNLGKNRFAEAVKNIEKAKEIEASEGVYQNEFHTKLSNALLKLGKTEEALASCNAALAYNERNVDVLMTRAEIRESNFEYEEAIADIKKAMEFEDSSQRLKEKLQRYEKGLKQSLKRDYYKILGLPRNCDKKAINKAYRTLAQKWHPDKFSDEKEKEEAEKMFMDIAAAKEVLSDKDKRNIFDSGDDPLDPEVQQQRNQQGHGFNPFQQGGFNFHFRR